MSELEPFVEIVETRTILDLTDTQVKFS